MSVRINVNQQDVSAIDVIVAQDSRWFEFGFDLHDPDYRPWAEVTLFWLRFNRFARMVKKHEKTKSSTS